MDQSYVGSNPTPRTITTPTYHISEFEEFLRTKVTKKGTSLAEATIKHRVKAIKSLLKRVNLWDCETVQTYIDQAIWTNGRKEHVSLAYYNWCEWKGFEYKRKKYPRQLKLPYLPTEKEIDQLILNLCDFPTINMVYTIASVYSNMIRHN